MPGDSVISQQGDPGPRRKLTDEQIDKAHSELEQEKRGILDDAAAEGRGLTEAEHGRVDAIDQAIRDLYGPEDDGPASDEEAMTGEELDAADRQQRLEGTLTGEELDALDRQEEEREQGRVPSSEPGDFPVTGDGPVVGDSGGSGGGSGDGGPGDGGGSGGGSGDGSGGGGGGDGGGSGGGDGDGGGGTAASPNDDGSADRQTVHSGPSLSGSTVGRLGDLIGAHHGGNVDPVADGEDDAPTTLHVTPGEASRLHGVQHADPSRLAHPHSDPRVTDPGPA
jgi:hypothetical protein